MKNTDHNRRSFTVAALAVLVAVAGSLACAPPAAAVDDGCSSTGVARVHTVAVTGVNDIWQGFFNTAMSRWNNAGVSASITNKATSMNVATAGSYSSLAWYGLYSPGYTIQINAYTITRDAPSAYATNWYLSTTTHEFGHALSLYDDPVTTLTSLMKSSRDRSTVGSPTGYDTANVKACYA